MDLESHTREMNLLFGPGYGNAACQLAEQFGQGGIAERLVAALEKQGEDNQLRADLAAARAATEQARREGQEIAAGLHERIKEIEAQAAAEKQRADRLAAVAVAAPLEAAACRQKLLAESDVLKDQVARALRNIAGAGHLVYLDAWDLSGRLAVVFAAIAAVERQGGA